MNSVSSFRSIRISPSTVSDSSKAFLEIGLAHLLALRIRGGNVRARRCILDRVSID